MSLLLENIAMWLDQLHIDDDLTLLIFRVNVLFLVLNEHLN